jgi:hypothetical protein
MFYCLDRGGDFGSFAFFYSTKKTQICRMNSLSSPFLSSLITQELGSCLSKHGNFFANQSPGASLLDLNNSFQKRREPRRVQIVKVINSDRDVICEISDQTRTVFLMLLIWTDRCYNSTFVVEERNHVSTHSNQDTEFKRFTRVVIYSRCYCYDLQLHLLDYGSFFHPTPKH